MPFLFSGCLAANFVYTAIEHTKTKTKTDAMFMQIDSDKQIVTIEIDRTISRYHLLMQDIPKQKHVKYSFPLTHPPKHAKLVQFKYILKYYDDEPKILPLPSNTETNCSADHQNSEENKEKQINRTIEFYSYIRLRSPYEEKHLPKNYPQTIDIPKRDITTILHKPILGWINDAMFHYALLIPYKMDADVLYCYLPDIDADMRKVMGNLEETSINIPYTIGASIIAVPILACDILLLPIEIPCAVFGMLLARAMGP
jgi:hypothetical protein